MSFIITSKSQLRVKPPLLRVNRSVSQGLRWACPTERWSDNAASKLNRDVISGTFTTAASYASHNYSVGAWSKGLNIEITNSGNTGQAFTPSQVWLPNLSNEAFTLAFTVNPVSLAVAGKAYCSIGSTGTDNSPGLLITEGAADTSIIRVFVGGGYNLTSLTGAMVDGQYRRVVFTSNGNDYMALYLDGVLIDSYAGAGANATESIWMTRGFGASQIAKYDNFMMWDRALAGGEVKADYVDPYRYYVQPRRTYFLPPAATTDSVFIVTSKTRARIKPAVSRIDRSHPLAKHVSFAVFAGEGGGAPHSVYPLLERATVHGGDPAWGMGLYGNVLDYDGVGDDSHIFPSRAVVSTSRPFTLAFRFLARSAPNNYPHVLQLKTGVANDAFALFYSTITSWQPYTFNFGGNTGMGPTTGNGTLITYDAWYTLAIAYGGATPSSVASWTLYENGKAETVITTDSVANKTDVTLFGAENGKSYESDIQIDYCVVLDGIEAPELLQRPEQVLELIDSPRRTYFMPSAAGATTTTSDVPASDITLTAQPPTSLRSLITNIPAV